MQMKIVGGFVLCLIGSFNPGPALHDPPDLSPKVVNSIGSVQLVAIEKLRESYLLVLRNNSKKALRRLEWTTARNKQQRRGAFQAPASGVGSGALFDVVISRIEITHEEDEDELEENRDAHRQTIVLKAALFVKGEADGDVEVAIPK